MILDIFLVVINSSSYTLHLYVLTACRSLYLFWDLTSRNDVNYINHSQLMRARSKAPGFERPVVVVVAPSVMKSHEGTWGETLCTVQKYSAHRGTICSVPVSPSSGFPKLWQCTLTARPVTRLWKSSEHIITENTLWWSLHLDILDVPCGSATPLSVDRKWWISGHVH